MTQNKKFLNGISISIGALTFLYIFGINFLFSKTTFFYHFDHPLFLTGYLSFINDSWHFPLGVTDNIYPGSNFSIVWTDSIPIYSIFLKIIKTLFGIKISNPFPLWYFTCYLLSSYYIGKILQTRTNNIFNYVFGIFILINTPLMVNRMIFHSALSSHWLILAVIYYYIINEENNYKNFFGYALITAISLFIHPYLFTILFPIYFISILKSFFLKKNIALNIKSLFIFSVLIAFYFFGVLTNFSSNSNNSIRRRDYIKYGAEFNSFFCGENPVWIINKYLWCNPPYTQIHHEGYAYLGVGIIFLTFLFFFNIKSLIKSLKKNKLLILVLFSMLLYSFGNKWKIAHVQIFEFQPTKFHLNLLEIFRSTGRYTWALYYFLAVFAVLNIFKLENKKLATLILFFALSLQLVESYNVYPGKSGWFKLNNIPTAQVTIAKNIFELNGEQILHVLPDERCASMPQADHYIVALEFLNLGGKVQTTRTSRLLLDFDFCENYSIEKSIKTYSPFHFVINDISLLNKTNFRLDYQCIILPKYIHEDSNPAYCTKQK